ncbi:hypothetical protein HanIR_Chr17g0894641 [Helianthus annuus]|nr:hypothetical protein HanIR_Chr17g0894641 [Helianthus annuus]
MGQMFVMVIGHSVHQSLVMVILFGILCVHQFGHFVCASYLAHLFGHFHLYISLVIVVCCFLCISLVILLVVFCYDLLLSVMVFLTRLYLCISLNLHIILK